MVCRYLFVRCDNEPAPWTRLIPCISLYVCVGAYMCRLEFILVMVICSDECGDRPRSLPVVKELKGAIDITERKKAPSWDYDVSDVVCYYVFLRFLDI